jgi:dTDP-4-amino-4,6-dideoxygalactose transaminase
VLNVKLTHLDRWTEQRRRNAARYRSLFQESRLLDKGVITLPEEVYFGVKLTHGHIYNQFVIRAQKRDGLREHLNKQRIGAEVYYPVPFHLQECLASLGYKRGDFTWSESAAQETIALPVYPELGTHQQASVVQTVRDYYAE